jgi:hypothetical protein
LSSSRHTMCPYLAQKTVGVLYRRQ